MIYSDILPVTVIVIRQYLIQEKTFATTSSFWRPQQRMKKKTVNEWETAQLFERTNERRLNNFQNFTPFLAFNEDDQKTDQFSTQKIACFWLLDSGFFRVPFRLCERMNSSCQI